MGRSLNDQSSPGDAPAGDVEGLQVLDTAKLIARDSLDHRVLDLPQNTETGDGSGDPTTGNY